MFLQSYMDWPAVTGWTIGGIIITAIVFFFLFTFMRQKYRRQVRDETHWLIMQSYLIKNNLISGEIAIVKDFFYSLSEADQVDILSSRTMLRNRLLYYLKETQKEVPEKIVNITDKLFPTSGHETELESLYDLYAGELCAIEGNNEHHLATVMKFTGKEILIRIEDFDPSIYKIDDSVKLYVYRPLAGGFIISGNIKELGSEAMIIRFSGQIEEKGEKYLMAKIQTEVEFVPWPVDEKRSKTNRVTGISTIVSDRAILFKTKYKHEVEYLARRNDLWLCKLTLPSGFNFSCRGIIHKSKMDPDFFLFKFLDAPETSHKVLFTEIRENQPVREKLY